MQRAAQWRARLSRCDPIAPTFKVGQVFWWFGASCLTHAARGAVESAFEPLDDVTCVGMISELLDWARVDPVLARLADPGRTYLCGHSRARTMRNTSAPVCFLRRVLCSGW